MTKLFCFIYLKIHKMSKQVYIYISLAVILIVPTVLPTFLIMNELNCEISSAVDSEEDGEEIEDTEVKIVNLSYYYDTYCNIENKNKITRLIEEYNSISENLDYPPPELI